MHLTFHSYLFYISASGLNVFVLKVSACEAITALLCYSIDYSLYLTFAAKPALNFVHV